MSALQTVDEFCRDNGLSRPMFYKLRRQGKAPRITKVGKLTRVSAEAAAEWRSRMERETQQATLRERATRNHHPTANCQMASAGLEGARA